MMKMLAGLKDRVIGSPVSTLTGALVGAFNLLLHMAAVNVNWAQTREVVVTAAGTIVPMVIGALAKKTPQASPMAQALTQKISAAAIAAAEQAAAAVVDKAIAEMQKLAGVPAPEIPKEGTIA